MSQGIDGAGGMRVDLASNAHVALELVAVEIGIDDLLIVDGNRGHVSRDKGWVDLLDQSVDNIVLDGSDDIDIVVGTGRGPNELWEELGERVDDMGLVADRVLLQQVDGSLDAIEGGEVVDDVLQLVLIPLLDRLVVEEAIDFIVMGVDGGHILDMCMCCFNNIIISGGTADNFIIGNQLPAPGTFTSITVTGGVWFLDVYGHQGFIWNPGTFGGNPYPGSLTLQASLTVDQSTQLGEITIANNTIESQGDLQLNPGTGTVDLAGDLAISWTQAASIVLPNGVQDGHTKILMVSSPGTSPLVVKGRFVPVVRGGTVPSGQSYAIQLQYRGESTQFLWDNQVQAWMIVNSGAKVVVVSS
ncbi:uncharacterized protein BJ171DRAFT_542407 [Polychytrium aggregatum]|uniref:uncharacterized protein n=1 Tax=Polychytrium aggregatum TaxID=110093 RepID=UPI0022FDDE82|nr:uncharacterized protein BJ171DRAFT_542407 [Polychytrium aggregatum]KAI9190678.1 hypothetical protein BJ171DRAFT_542407 [Polychytrium aggregatum]